MAQRVVRLLPGGMEAELAAQHTFPFKLAKIEFHSPVGTKFYSTGPQVELEGNTYLPGLANVGELAWGPDGDQSGQIELYNGTDDDTPATDLVLASRVAEVPVTVYSAYLKADGTYVATRTAVGVLTDSVLTPSGATVTMVTGNIAAERLPNRPITFDEGFHWLPPVGSTLTWGGETYVFEEGGA